MGRGSSQSEGQPGDTTHETNFTARMENKTQPVLEEAVLPNRPNGRMTSTADGSRTENVRRLQPSLRTKVSA